MTPTELREDCTREAIRIWRDYAGRHRGAPGAGLIPLLLEDYGVGAELLFVGSNPSFSPNMVESILHSVFPDQPEVNAFFAWDVALDDTKLRQIIDEVVRFETKARVVYDKYFKPLQDFAKQVDPKITHAHIDMFLIRHTSQKEVKAAYGHTFEKIESTPFAFEQFKLFRDTLKAMKPKVVIIASAYASDLAVSGMKLKSPDAGRTYRWSEMQNVPIFLSGMLSGQRALDTYSRDRLALDVKIALQAIPG